MTINSDEYKSVVGLKNLHIAEILQDDRNGFLADTPEYFAPAAEASAAPAVNRSTQYADDQPFDAMSSEGETTIQLTVTNIPMEILAKITGRVFDATTGRMYDNSGTPPYFALAFESVKSNGKKRFYQYLKGRFDMPGDEFSTRKDSPEPKTPQITFTAVKTIFAFDLGDINDGAKRVIGDEDTTSFSGATWYDQVQVPGVSAPSALALASSVPVDAATGIAVGSDITLTFNNALGNNAINGIVVLDDAFGAVACAKSLSSTRKVVTINPSSNLDISTEYTVVIGVTDIYGQTLDTAIQFTTAGA